MGGEEEQQQQRMRSEEGCESGGGDEEDEAKTKVRSWACMEGRLHLERTCRWGYDLARHKGGDLQEQRDRRSRFPHG